MGICSQLVNAMKTVGYFDVSVVDYKFRYIQSCIIETNNSIMYHNYYTIYSETSLI